MMLLRWAAAATVVLCIGSAPAWSACKPPGASGFPAGGTRLDTQTRDSVELTGGCIDGIPIGQNTPAAGTFTDLTIGGSLSGIMAQNASNATLPGARTNLGLGTTSTPAFAGLSLAGPSGIIATDRILSVAYGTVGTPLPTHGEFGGSAFSSIVYATPGVGIADAITVAVQGDTHLTAGSRGIAVGGIFRAYTSGTWGPGGSFFAESVGVWAEGFSSKGGAAHGGFFGAYADTTTVTAAGITGVEIDVSSSVSTPAKWGLVILSANADTGTVTGSATVAISGASVLQSSAIMVQAPIAGATGFKYGITTIDSGAEQPIQVAGSLWRSGGYTVVNGLDWPDMTFSGQAIRTPNFTVDGAGNVSVLSLQLSAVQFATSAAGYTYIAGGDGLPNVLVLGGTADPVNYYDRATHSFRGDAGVGESARITSAGVDAVGYKVGGIVFASNTSGVTYIAGGDGLLSVLILGGAADPTNYYDNTTHSFRGSSGVGEPARITSTGIDAVGYKTGGVAGITKSCVAAGATLIFTNGLLTSTAVC